MLDSGTFLFLAESAARLMYLRVYDSRDSSRQPAPSPSLSYSLTHPHRSIGYRNRNPQLLSESVVRLMYLRVYDSRDSSRQPAPSPSLWYSLTHGHRSIGYRNRNPQLLAGSAARLMHLRVYDNRDRSHQSGGAWHDAVLVLGYRHYSTWRQNQTQPKDVSRLSLSSVFIV